MQRLRNIPGPRRCSHMYTTENGAEIADHDKFLILTKLFAGHRVGRTKDYQILATPGFPRRRPQAR